VQHGQRAHPESLQSGLSRDLRVGRKTAIDIGGRTRIPDGLTSKALTEIKNVGRLSYTSQLRDYTNFAQQTGREFNLFVRPTTQLSGPLQEAIGAGDINLFFIP
jgi:hypothetical protein